jgi:DNA modification methylase
MRKVWVMSLYWSGDGIELHLGDCREIDEWLAADVLVTDPPYGMAYQSGQRKGAKLSVIAGDGDTSIRDRALECWGAVKPGLVFGRWSVTAPVGERQRLIWWKEGNPGMGDLSIPWGPAHEDIHLLGAGWDRTQAGVKRVGSVISTRGVRGGAAGEENLTGHPTPKPVHLMEYLITRCPPGTIADPFAGSGSTLVAAKLQGRKAIGVELEERYCEIAARRLDQGVLDFGTTA